MKAISLHQPWASLIAIGAKPWETRSWAPPPALIGQRIAIQAAKSKASMGDLEEDIDLWAPLARHFALPIYLPFGAVVCTAVLQCAVRLEPSQVTDRMRVAEVRGRFPSAEQYTVAIDPFGDYSPGRWAWRLTDIERFEPPISARGAQGFWEWTPP